MAESKGLMLGVSFRPVVAWLIPKQERLYLQGVLRQRQQTAVADPGDTWGGQPVEDCVWSPQNTVKTMFQVLLGKS